MSTISYRYGRMLGDFQPGATSLHPWELTLDEGTVAVSAASFQDATPLWASAAYARELGFAARPIHPLLCLNLALSFSVHDVSEQAIAHLAYVDVRFPNAAYVGDTVQARSTVIAAKPASSGDRGVVQVRTVLDTLDGKTVCAFERKALIRAGQLPSRPVIPGDGAGPDSPPIAEVPTLPPELRASYTVPRRPQLLPGCFEDFAPGQVYAHAIGRTVGDSEHMQLTTLYRNSHPLHFDALYCQDSSFTKKRVVYGGLVFGFVSALTSRDLAGNALWELGYRNGAHPNSVAAGDTLYAISKVTAVEDRGPQAGAVSFQLVGVKNATSEAALEKYGDALFTPELWKKEGRIPEKVLEIERTLLVRKRTA